MHSRKRLSKISRRSFLVTIGMAAIHPGGFDVSPLYAMAAEGSFESIFWRPGNAWVGDTIPYCENGVFRIFYLHDWRDPNHHPPGTEWYQVSTRDLLHFTDRGQMIGKGRPGEQDASVATGSILKNQGEYHAFYTGYSRERKENGQPEQGICHATGTDLDHWSKSTQAPLFADTAIYEKDDWRDPFVFWNEETHEYWMLCAARLKDGPPRRRGCTALCVSKDLKSWDARPPFYAPDLYETHECPDLFHHEGWWYLIFSEFSDRSVTRYRMSRSLAGPWMTPVDDTFDGRAFYAAKTAYDGRRRLLFGWIPTRNENKDYAFWNWGGNLGFHEIVFLTDGTLGVKPPEEVRTSIRKQVPLTPVSPFGHAAFHEGSVELDARKGFASITLGQLPSKWRLEATVRVSPDTRVWGLALHADQQLSRGYTIRMEPERSRMSVESYPRPDANSPFMMGLERPLTLPRNQDVHVTAIGDADIAVIYVNNQAALTSRMEDLQHSHFGVFAEGGTATFTRLMAFGS